VVRSFDWAVCELFSSIDAMDIAAVVGMFTLRMKQGLFPHEAGGAGANYLTLLAEMTPAPGISYLATSWSPVE
jgi:hypothetical protein